MRIFSRGNVLDNSEYSVAKEFYKYCISAMIDFPSYWAMCMLMQISALRLNCAVFGCGKKNVHTPKIQYFQKRGEQNITRETKKGKKRKNRTYKEIITLKENIFFFKISLKFIYILCLLSVLECCKIFKILMRY